MQFLQVRLVKMVNEATANIPNWDTLNHVWDIIQCVSASILLQISISFKNHQTLNTGSETAVHIGERIYLQVNEGYMIFYIYIYILHGITMKAFIFIFFFFVNLFMYDVYLLNFSCEILQTKSNISFEILLIMLVIQIIERCNLSFLMNEALVV